MDADLHRLSKDELIHIIAYAACNASVVSCRISDMFSACGYLRDAIGDYVERLAENADSISRVTAMITIESQQHRVSCAIHGFRKTSDTADYHDHELGVSFVMGRCTDNAIEIKGSYRDRVCDFIKSLPNWDKFDWRNAGKRLFFESRMCILL